MNDINVTDEEIQQYYDKLKNYVKDFIYNFSTNQQIFQADAEQIAKIRHYVDYIIKNCFILLSDEYSVQILESEFGIIPKPTDTLDIRKSRLLARKRGMATTTPYVIKQISSAFVDKVNLVQHFEDYYFELQLENINKGFANFLEDLVEIIEELKPAHLGVHYELIETIKSNLYIGSTTCSAEIITVYPWSPNNIEMKTNVYFPFSNDFNLETVTIYPKSDNTNDDTLYILNSEGYYEALDFE